MRRRSRKVRVMKWVGLVGCVLLSVGYSVSGWWTVQLHFPNFDVSITSGGTVGNSIYFHPHEYYTGIRYTALGCELQVNRNRPEWGLAFNTPMAQPILVIPMWLPLLVIAVPTAILWRLDRRYPPGCCQRCGYDLTGNVSGVCSECGAEAEQAS